MLYEVITERALVHKSKSRRSASIQGCHLDNLVAFRHSKMGHFVECQASDQRLRDLCFDQACWQFSARDGFQSKHGGFYQRTHVIARIFLPTLSSMFTNVTQILISFEAFGFWIAMLPNASVFARRDQYLNCWRVFIECIVHFALIVGSVCSTSQ